MTKYPSEKESQIFDFSKNRLTRAKSIRLKCLDCCCYSESEVRTCSVKTCPLWPYRLGVGKAIPIVSLPQLRKKAQKFLYRGVSK